MINILFADKEEVSEKIQQVEELDMTNFDDIKTYFENSLYDLVRNTSQEAGPETALMYLIIMIIAFFLLKNLFNYLAVFYVTYLRNGVLKDLRNDVYTKILELPVSFYSEKRKGDVISRISADVGVVQTSTLSVLELVVREPLTILFAVIAMFVISVKLTLFVFIFIPIAGFLISLLGKKLKKQSQKVQEEQGVFLSTLEETLTGLRIIKSYNALSLFTKRFQESTQRFNDYSVKLAHRQSLASPTSEFLGIATIAALLWYGGTMVLVDGTLSGGAFIGYMGLSYQILTPAKAISKASYMVKAGNAAADRVLELLDQESSLKDKSDAFAKASFNDNIKFNNITFAYEELPVLKGFTLKVNKGQKVALVGQSGSGKSTIASLLNRFYDVGEGSIEIDGYDIRNLTKESLRDLIGFVSQDSILFNETIKNNVTLGKEDVTDEEVIEALKIANAWEFVKDFPNGIHTNVGDSGGKLSGGQKQRVSIARAVLKNPPIMLLDEATSALDTESERLVQDALEKMMRNRTSIVIAHRLSTIQNSDHIVVLERGQIVEQGNHKSLMQQQTTYYSLVNMQSLV
jgi:subfamily B ATP-binding cassette protein MsbA